MLTDVLNFLGAERYSQHAICLTNDSLMIFLYVLADLSTWAAYFTIGLALLVTGRLPDTTLLRMKLLFGAFIFLCGLSHLTMVMTIFSGVYRLDILVRAAMAGVSVVTACLVVQQLSWRRT